MLTVRYIKENTQEAIERLAVKNFDAADQLAAVIVADDKRVAIQQRLNDLQSEMNALSKTIGQLLKEKKTDMWCNFLILLTSFESAIIYFFSEGFLL